MSGPEAQVKFDLENGFLQAIVPASGRNAWQTRIESQLIKNGETEAFLATACRSENVAADMPIFGSRTAEVSIIKGFEQNYIMRRGAGVIHPFQAARHAALRYNPFAGDVEVYGGARPVRFLCFQELHQMLTEGNAGNKVFLSLTYEQDGSQHEIVTHCRYLNFAKPGYEPIYVQPISGYVLIETGGRFQVAYVAAHCLSDAAVTAEFILAGDSYIFDLKKNFFGAGVRWLGYVMQPLRRMLLTDEFTHISTAPAHLRFFVYV